ncbi:MAG: ABC transporter ATP-binding protein/permease [Lachnospiraceae bacterium]|nr:ABC transporter ATP-binding protein/permease [Lachnospiraceae bacterium]
MEKKESQGIKPKKGLPRLMELAMTQKAPMVGGMILSALATIASFLPYLAIYLIIQEIVGAYPDFDALDVPKVMGFGGLALGGVLLNVLLYTASVALSHIAAYGTLYQCKINYVSHITKLPLGYHLKMGSGRLRKIMDDNIESLEGFIAHDLPNMISAFVAPVVMLVLVFAVDWRFGLAAFVGIIFSFLIYGVTSGGDKTKKLMEDYQTSLEDMSNASVEYIRGIAVVKAFRQTAFSFKQLYDSIKNYTKTVIPYSLSQELMTAALSAALNGIYLFLIPVGIWIGSSTNDYPAFAASFIFYLIFVPVIASVLMKMIYASVNAMQVGNAVERFDQILAEPEIPETNTSQKPSAYDVVYDHVTFSYAEGDTASAPQTESSQAPKEKSTSTGAPQSVSSAETQKKCTATEAMQSISSAEPKKKILATEALQSVSFTAPQGKITAIVGPSGGGKSTIASLLPRFYDVEQGAIRIGGTDIRDMSIGDLMDTVSFVFQDNFLFKQSILENIRMGRPGATEEEVVAAAKAARCHEFITELPQGYQTVFGKNQVKLSGGQIQRIAIARTIVKNAPVLVLDEATSFSDPENEHFIQQALLELVKGKTVIMIAHRLSTVRNADQILVVDHGRIVQSGVHDELVSKEGRYQDLWSNYTKALTWKFSAGREA